MRRRTHYARWAAPLLACGLLAFAGCSEGTKVTPSGSGPSSIVKEGNGTASPSGPELPVLVEIESVAGKTYTRVLLHFEPGGVEPAARVEEYDKSTVPVPASGKPVDLPGDQALRVSVSPAQLDNVNVAAVRRGDPAVTEVRVLGASGDTVRIAIGVQGHGDLRPRVYTEESDTDPETHLKYDTIVVSLRNPQVGE